MSLSSGTGNGMDLMMNKILIPGSQSSPLPRPDLQIGISNVQAHATEMNLAFTSRPQSSGVLVGVPLLLRHRGTCFPRAL